jgi:hypothetical protein
MLRLHKNIRTKIAQGNKADGLKSQRKRLPAISSHTRAEHIKTDLTQSDVIKSTFSGFSLRVPKRGTAGQNVRLFPVQTRLNAKKSIGHLSVPGR